MVRIKGVIALATVIGALLSVDTVMAQVTTSTVSGSVVDAGGNSLSSVQIVVINQSTGVQRGTVTASTGRFIVPGLRPGGPYRVEAQLIGYATASVDNLQLALGENRVVNFTMRQEAVAVEGIEVTAERPTGLRNGVATVIDAATLQNSPTLNREIVDVARLTPQAFVSNEDDDGAAISIAGQNAEFNGLFIDGVVTNDVFGLSAQGTPGGQTGAPPISFDALEQMQIAISPFDVTQSGFTGGAINAITRSGTNRFSGSLYFQMRNPELAGKTPGPDFLFDENNPRKKLPEFSNNRYGFRLGGPIIENKAFFFISGELFRSETPRPFLANAWRGSTPCTAASCGVAEQIREVVTAETGYDPGDFREQASSLDDNKILAKIDWNLNANHRLTLRHSYSHSDNIDAFGSGGSTINFSNNVETFPNTTNSSAFELNSRFGEKYANRLLAGVTFVRDDRGFAGDPFPAVTIQNGSGNLRLGSDQFSTGNVLNQDVFSITNNLNIFAGKHTFTVGAHAEYYDIMNLFIRQNFGVYTYRSVDDFLRSVCASGNRTSSYCRNLAAAGPITAAEPTDFQRGYSLVDNELGDASAASAAFTAYQFGAYVQDEMEVNDRLRLTAGIRVDVPKIPTKPRFSEDVFTTTIPAVSAVHDLEGAQPGKTPEAQPYIAPRIGFTYDLTEDGVTRLRGGVGLFSGRVPFVYPGAMYTNNGVTTGFVRRSGRLPNGQPIPFVPDPRNALDAADFGLPTKPNGELDMFAKDFRYPRVLRTSLGLDTRLPMGFTGTLEGQYTKNQDNILVRNVNYKAFNDFLDGPDKRPIMNYGYNTRFNSLDVNAGVIDPRYGNGIYVVSSVNEGYAYDLTASVQREFFNRSLFAKLAYTYGDSYSLNDATSDQISSTQRFNENVRGLNNLDLARSDWSIGHRVLGVFSYRKEFLKNLGTTLSAVYTGESGRPYSFIIGNNFAFTGEGSGTSPLAFVPNNGADFKFQPFTSGGRTYTAAEQQAAFEAFIAGDEYLSGRRGDYAERNAARTPFEHVVDLKIAQELFGNFAGRRNAVELTLDIFNFTNLLNKKWGWRYDPGFRTVDLLRFERLTSATDLTPIYTFRLPSFQGSGGVGVESMDEYWEGELIDFGSYGSRWLMQFGVRYTF